jgi:uncharacterized protein (DUF924 family)
MDPGEVVEFWFGTPARTPEEVMQKTLRWFRGGEAMDREARERFGRAVERAVRGELDAWAEEPSGRLALVLLLDQLTRNVFRGDPARMYAGDARAQRLALEAFDRGMDRGLPYEQRLFLSMPLLHAEDLALQRRAGAIAAALAAEAPPQYAQMAAMNREQTAKYTSVIERFGRFPHRNAVLGRASTPEEEEFLKDWDERAPPKGMPR